MRERGASSALPPLYFLHVWWARRPLTVSRAAILGSLLPVWHRGLPLKLLNIFPTQESYHEWFLHLVGIYGDPVAGRKLISLAKDRGIKLGSDPYGYKRAFTRNPSREQMEILYDLMETVWGTRDISVCDPMAGGGSIPFEAMRFDFSTFTNEFNPVASIVLKATLDFPTRFGPGFAGDIRKWGNILSNRVKERLDSFYPKKMGESIHAYIWARTVACPTTGKPVPLSPNWWLRKGSEPIAVRLVVDPKLDICQFEIVKDKVAVSTKPDEGTVKKGVGRSPWTGDSIDGDYIKAEAQAGRMGQQLYAIATKTDKGFIFRIPSDDDLEAAKIAEKELIKHLPDWEARGLVPFEERYSGPADRSINYGIVRWSDCFSSRQLFSMLTIVDEVLNLQIEMERECGKEKANAIRTYLGLAVDKCADYNSILCKWDGTRNKITNTFDRHDFSFKWSFGEFDAAANLLPWTINQVSDAYAGIAKLAERPQDLFIKESGQAKKLEITKGSAASLPTIPENSIYAIVVDPPYADNVMYAECSDFFYVWQKRTLGSLFPDWFNNELTNKDDEAVANQSRFDGAKNKAKLATSDYERKMAACFREMHRILRQDGVLTVMFTHKKVEAWNTLATSLIGAGFTIQTSWPVHTESEHSLHQAKKNSASSTILLVCRKREQQTEPVWWDDVKGKVREEARSKARAFHAQGITGVDLYISSFGPVLSILSKNWPVLSSETDVHGHPMPLQPEVALDIAREEVIALRKEELLHGVKVQFDPFTDWYLMAWDAFQAEQFPGDEARKLAIVLGLDLERDIISGKKIATKKGADVVLQQPIARRKKGSVDEDANSFSSLLDAAHTTMLVYDEDGSKACESFLKRTSLFGDSTFKLVLQAMINAIPRTRGKNDEFVRPETRTLDAIRLAFFTDLTAPPEEDLTVLASSPPLFVLPDEEDDDSAIEEEEGSED